MLEDLSGPLRHRFGTMRDLVIGVTVTLPDGTRANSGGKVVKNVAGYDLGKLFCGSRGRLGRVEQLALRLHPLPAASRTVATDAARWRELHRSGLVPSAVDLAGDRMHVLFEGVSSERCDAQAHALGGEEAEPWASCARCRPALPGPAPVGRRRGAARPARAARRVRRGRRTSERGARSPNASWRRMCSPS